MKRVFINITKKIYVFIFGRKIFSSFNTFLYNLSLNGLGILNYENDNVSGEKAFINYLISNNKFSAGVIMDIGANIGNYSIMLRKKKITAPIFSFEPHPATFKNLLISAEKYKFSPIPKGMGEKEEHVKIYDYSVTEGSEHASIFKDVIEHIHKSKAVETDIELTTIDLFVAENNISKIALLKIDTEGNEKNVLKGAKNTIQNNLIEVIQIEFNEMNVVSRTFMKDLVDLLPSYTFYRLIPDGMRPMGNYNAINYEIFAFQNIVAIKNKQSDLL